jgi:UDP-N-acetyl-D-glucosamine/UDP-N-acetyl-D-galactosamine dehydrogenase
MKIKNNLFQDLENRKSKVAIVGLGYVGIPLLVSLNRYFDVVGFDINKEKIDALYNSDDFDDIINKDELKKLNCKLSSDENIIKEASFFIITVPTPIDVHNDPDLSMIINATRLVGRNMPKNSIIVYESTVYPGVTEEICLPILEKESGLANKTDFWVGYSPERINPGDKVHDIENVVKVVAAQDEYSLSVVESVYAKIVKAGVYKTKNIKTAEAAKVIENTQRDLNIALINELSIFFSKLGLDTREVLSAARTKWNFLDFYPGLVGGHCIGVDPYYLTFKAKEIGFHTEVILAGRKINDSMAFFIGDEILKRILNNGKLDGKIKVILFGLSFKENIKDIRNSKVPDIRSHLIQYGIDVEIFDPVVSQSEAKKEYGINLIKYEDIHGATAVVFCVAHDCFKNINLKDLKSKLNREKPHLFDIKGIFNKEDTEKYGFDYWRL